MAEEPEHRPPSLVVGIGASAGGLESLERLFRAMPEGTGIAFVVVQHLSPEFESLMDELLARKTKIPIQKVSDGDAILGDRIYLLPPRKEMIVSGGRLLLTDRETEGDLTLPIDLFFRSLAQDVGERAVAVVLSGTGSDGSRGIREVSAAGGLVIVQSHETAKFDGMPRSAVDTGVVDLVLAPEEIPAALARYRAFGRKELDEDALPVASQSDLDELFHLLRSDHGIDFSHYKAATVSRRIERRLAFGGGTSLQLYIDRLASDAEERDRLYRDLLIGVTRFFRDEPAFGLLEREILPGLIERVPAGRDLRAWVAGCATGEEAYSLAILLWESFQAQGRPVAFKVFATDVHEPSLEQAAAGIYRSEELAGLSRLRIDRFFNRKGETCQVRSDLRQTVVFARHNLIKDPPFTRIDLVSCRNLLIYLRHLAQKKALSLLHFGLRSGGILLLGPSETLGGAHEGFETVDDRWRVYRKRGDIRLRAERLPAPGERGPVQPGPLASAVPVAQLLGVYDTILEESIPPGLLIDERRRLVHTFSGAGRYLQIPDGRPSADVLESIRPELRVPLASALRRATRDRDTVALSPVELGSEDHPSLTIKVMPIEHRASEARYFLITFAEGAERGPRPHAVIDPSSLSQEQISGLEAELRYTKENLQTTIEELETSNEELQATNQELVAANEELQSTNEELQSVNEELYTVNAEFQKKIAELTQLSNDVEHLLASTEIGSIFLDRELRIRKFTPRISTVFRLLQHDLGRPIQGFSHNLSHPGLIDDLREVLATARRLEREVRDQEGRWFLLRILPYKSPAGVEGLVMTLVEITVQKHAEELAVREVHRRDEFLAMLSHELRNPLAAVMNAAQLAAADPGFRERAFDVILRQSEQTARLLDDLLDVSRVTTRKIELRLAPVEVGALLRDAAEAVRPTIDAGGFELHCELPERPLAVEGDGARLQQVLVNLLVNAARYSPPSRRIWLSAAEQDGQAVLRVRDEGYGIPSDLIDSVFDLFVQGERTLDRPGGGLGIGLTLVRSLVELHGGNVQVSSDGPGEGTEVVVRLPLVSLDRQEPRPAPEAARERPAVVLIEDDEDNRAMLRLLLGHEGYEITAAEDGESGVELVVARLPQVALVDIGLPGIDGYEVARRIRARVGSAVWLVALTGYGQPSDRESARAAGFDAHVVKPLRPGKLAEILPPPRRDGAREPSS